MAALPLEEQILGFADTVAKAFFLYFIIPFLVVIFTALALLACYGILAACFFLVKKIVKEVRAARALPTDTELLERSV